MSRAEHERTVEEIEAQAKFEWGQGGVRGDLGSYTDGKLREALLEALELNDELEDFTAFANSLPDEIGFVQAAAAHDAQLIEDTKGVKRLQHMLEMLRNTLDRERKLSEELKALKDEKPAPVVQLVTPHARTARAKLGATTMLLPGIVSNDIKLPEPDVPKLGGKVKRTRKAGGES